MSDPEKEDRFPTSAEAKAHLEYAMKIAEFLIPHVQDAMNSLPPPDGMAASGVAGFLHAFTMLGLHVSSSARVSSIEYARGMMLLARDIEWESVNRLATVIQAEPAKPKAEEQPKVEF